VSSATDPIRREDERGNAPHTHAWSIYESWLAVPKSLFAIFESAPL